VFDLLGGRAPCRLHLDREAAVLRVPRRRQENLGASLRRVVDRFGCDDEEASVSWRSWQIPIN